MRWLPGIGNTFVSLAWLLAWFGSWPLPASAGESGLPLSAPVKVLPSASQPDGPPMQAAAMPAEPDRSQPTMPGGKLPQYQLDHRHLDIPATAELDNARLRLMLALPAEPVLLEAHITIDGQPLHMQREQRIQRILEQMEATAAEDPLSESLPQRIRRYQQATGEAASAEEVRWMLTHWVDGPTVLLLNENFQRFRADQRPVFDVLDRNRDGLVEADELQRAVQAFEECDLNRNEIVEYTELAEVASDVRTRKPELTTRGSRLSRLPDDVTAGAIYRRLAARYATEKTAVVPRWDANSNGRFDAEELSALRGGQPDVTLTIAFDSGDPSLSRLVCTAVSPRWADSAKDGVVAAATLTLPLAGAEVTFSAVQQGASDQISLGAVDDGYPLLPLLDPNGDGRFTRRERRSLLERLRQFDRNRDQRITSDEAQSTIRVCFGLGPVVHRELAAMRSAPGEPPETVAPGPEWFVRMDRNKDNDLSRGEFPGTDEQFARLDADGDELVSAEEAHRLEQKSASDTQHAKPIE